MSLENSTFSRRSFLTGAAALGALTAAGVMGGCAPRLVEAPSEGAQGQAVTAADAADWLGEAPAISDSDCVETVDTDVLVIGAGTSGYFAAASAAESGARTLLIEKAANGNSVRSSALGAVNSKLQQAEGEKAAINPMEITNDMRTVTLMGRFIPPLSANGLSTPAKRWIGT